MNLREWARATHRALANQSADERHRDLSAAQVEQVMRASILTLAEALASGEQLRIDELGQIWAEERPSREVVSNLASTRRAYRIKHRRTVRFRPSKRLAVYINNMTSEL